VQLVYILYAMPPKDSLKASQKRARTSQARSGQPRLSIGAPTEDDLPSTAQQPSQSSSSPSTRKLPADHVPALTTLCARVFVINMSKLSQDESIWNASKMLIDTLPDTIIPNLFAMLRVAWPTYLSHALISQVCCEL
jgi:hypothetical protein